MKNKHFFSSFLFLLRQGLYQRIKWVKLHPQNTFVLFCFYFVLFDGVCSLFVCLFVCFVFWGERGGLLLCFVCCVFLLFVFCFVFFCVCGGGRGLGFFLFVVVLFFWEGNCVVFLGRYFLRVRYLFCFVFVLVGFINKKN